MTALPHVGQLLFYEGGDGGTVGMVTKAAKLKAGTKLTIVSSGPGFASTIQSKPLTELPAEGWQVVCPAKLYEVLQAIVVQERGQHEHYGEPCALCDLFLLLGYETPEEQGRTE